GPDIHAISQTTAFHRVTSIPANRRRLGIPPGSCVTLTEHGAESNLKGTCWNVLRVWLPAGRHRPSVPLCQGQYVDVFHSSTALLDGTGATSLSVRTDAYWIKSVRINKGNGKS